MPVTPVYRAAEVEDIPELHRIRMAVNENVLSNPDLITVKDYEEYLTKRGKGWLCEIDGKVAGFSIVDLKENNVWALFTLPDYEGKGIGSKLHDLMLNWYFDQTKETIWLGTEPETKAEAFYRKKGWREVGVHNGNEIKFEMTFSEWVNRSK